MPLRRRWTRLLCAAGLAGAAALPYAQAGAVARGGAGPRAGAEAPGGRSGPRLAAVGQRAGAEAPLRVATYNIAAGAGADHVFDPGRTARALRALRADVIGLQEVDVHWGARSQGRDLAAELADALGMRVFFAPLYSLGPAQAGGPRREFGVAVLSRLPVLSTGNHAITRLSTQDPHPVPAPAPGFGEAVVRVRGVPVHVYVTHLDYRADPAVRRAQTGDMLRIMAEDCDGGGRCPRQVLVGDFNAEAAAPELAPLWRRLTDAVPAGARPTYPAGAPVRRIDYVTVSDGIGVRGAAVAGTIASDHRPVVADLVVRREPP
ncbi:endonuclease/exonuclease/phosphatase family protein [Streptomyces sp. NPDC001922]|uniref:endonuclease/exonuclease/phosphatase family protein n=1 Tax=Streptomyces sp. NPDC001922 TaxID=3364624 RepID=UPI00367852C7